MAFRRFVCAAVLAFSGLCLARSARADVDLWPLFEHDKDTTTVMYPFYVHEGDFLMVFPAYYRTDDRHEHHVLWPLVKIRDGRLTRLAPFWFSSDPGKYWIFPLAYHDADETFFLVPPAYFKAHEFQIVAPLFVHTHTADDDWLVTGVRAFGWHKTRDQSHYFAGFLGDYTTRANGEWSGSLTPLLYTWGGSEKRGIVVPPLFWRTHTSDSSTLWLAGYLQDHSPTKDSWAMYPFIASKHETASNGDLTRRLSILWPIYKRKETTSAAGDMTYRHRRFLAFSDDTTPDRRQLSLFGFVVRESSNAGS
jgi:hypothetical protein